MLLSVDKCLATWLPAMRFALGPKRALEAQRKIRPIIEHAQKAEKDGRISDMQPLMAMCNPTPDVRAGYWRLEIRYQPIEDGKKQLPRSWITTILQPADNDDEPATAQAGKAVQR